MKLSEIARKIDCRMESDLDMEIHRVSGIEEAREGDLTFVANKKYLGHLTTTQASAIILGNDAAAVSIPSLRSDNPYLAFARALELFYQPVHQAPGIHPTAVVHRDAQIGKGCSIGPYAVIESGCRLGEGVVLYPHVVLYPNVILGDGCIVHAHSVVREECRLGKRVILQNGVMVGSDGFGFAPVKDGTYYKIVQSGSVIIEDDVEIGANTTIDRAAVGNTIIRKGAKLDNLVQVGHAAQVGRNAVLAAQVGLAGSTKVGNDVKIGGQAGLAGHMEVGDGAIIYAQCGTSHDVAPGAIIAGSPSMDQAIWLRTCAAIPRLPDLIRRVRELEHKFAQLVNEENAKTAKKA
jgi:UDP-3-O-[3-hydroxymyristoyl] glucosamine N-acyltransferase